MFDGLGGRGAWDADDAGAIRLAFGGDGIAVCAGPKIRGDWGSRCVICVVCHTLDLSPRRYRRTIQSAIATFQGLSTCIDDTGEAL